ncbi:Cell death protease [Basidiobolus ranarum]|uniref:Pheromone-processing carboxypeptidase KEX1 n=1 Tax=Basidiobolus ranarum TaxID=34480 RepID=A0ABR2WUW2_9FUNG
MNQLATSTMLRTPLFSKLILLLLFVTKCLGQNENQKTAAEYRITTLPGLPSGYDFEHYAGHIGINETINGHLFFWLFKSQVPNSKKLIIWLNGGPGCSSLDGVFLENGPLKALKTGKLLVEDNSWHKHANMLFLDQPIGTGYSYGDDAGYARTMDEVTNGFVVFLSRFFEVFPDLQLNDIYLAGESFAGVYIPYLADGILTYNDKPKNRIKRNLKGLVIGNGWIDPQTQYNSLVEYGYDRGLIKENRKDHIDSLKTSCNELFEKNGDRIRFEPCEEILETMLTDSLTDGKCINQFDIRLKDSYPECGMNWPAHLLEMYDYLKSDVVVTALHAEAKQVPWRECNDLVNTILGDDTSAPPKDLLPGLLARVPILLFYGDQDLVCNHIGIEKALQKIEWNGAKGFGNDMAESWFVNDKLVGMHSSARNLTYLRIFNASHMVPVDKRNESYAMINWFMGIEDASYKVNIGELSKTLPTNNAGLDEQSPPKDLDMSKPNNTADGLAIGLIVGMISMAAFVGVFLGWYIKRRQYTILAPQNGQDSELTDFIIDDEDLSD